MTVLAINIGNTNIHIGMYENMTLSERVVGVRQADFETNFIECIQSFLLIEDINCVRINSVNPAYTAQVTALIQQCLHVSIEYVNYESNWQVDYSLYETGKLGLDRMLACEAVYQKATLPAIVFDFGTATTMNVIDQNGVFCGGAIFPGVYMGLEALHQKTALLPNMKEIEQPVELLGLTTVKAMQSAAVYGNASMIEGMIERVCQLFQEEVYTYCTGGATPVLKPYITVPMQYEATLVLEGILSLNN